MAVTKAECARKKNLAGHSSVLPLRGQRRLKVFALLNPGGPEPDGVDSLLLPVELRRVNHTASTNTQDSTLQQAVNPTIRVAMPNQNPSDPIAERVIEQVTERVERLLLRHEELQRTNTLLGEQLAMLTQERDSLKSRLGAARARVDALLERLPENASSEQPSPVGTAQ